MCSKIVLLTTLVTYVHCFHLPGVSTNSGSDGITVLLCCLCYTYVIQAVSQLIILLEPALRYQNAPMLVRNLNYFKLFNLKLIIF